MSIFDDPKLGIKLIGSLKLYNSASLVTSRLAVGFETLDRDMFKPEPCYNYVSELGVKFARVQTAWIKCEKNKKQYDFKELDSVVNNLIERGVTPWFNLTYGNPLYMDDIPNEFAVGCIPNLYGEECLQGWLNYVKALAEHFKGRVCMWEIWNEPNVKAFWYPGSPSGEKYAEFVAQTAPVIRDVDSDAKIIGCCAGIAVEFVRRAVLAGIGKHIDYYSFHPYRGVPERDYFISIRNMRRLFAKYAPHVKLMQGECGYPSQTYEHHDAHLTPYNATEETQAKFVLRRVAIDYSTNMEIISYFHIADLMERIYMQSSGEARPPVMLGLLHGKKYTPKKSFYAMQKMCSLLSGNDIIPEDLFIRGWMNDFDERFAGVIPTLAPIFGTFSKKGYPFYFWYYPEDLQKEWHGNSSFYVSILPDETENELKEPVIIDSLSGKVYEVTNFGSNSYFSTEYHSLPLTDYPVFLTDKRVVAFETA